MDKPYVILSPRYDITSGGVKVMYGLYGWLLAKGVEVYVNCTPNAWKQEELVAIYPEIQDGKPIQTEKVVRYVLNTPGLMRGYDDKGNMLSSPSDFTGEKVYYFSQMFGKAEDNNHYLFLPAINLHIFKDLKQRRSKTCYLVGKGKNKHKHPDDSIELNRDVARSQNNLNEILNQCHTCYIYDDLTAMMEVSRLSGCRVEYCGKYSLDQLKNYEPGLNGVNRKLHVNEFREHYVDMIKIFEKKLDLFIEETQSW